MTKWILILGLSIALFGSFVQAQSAHRYKTTIHVNERVITAYEIEQRANMLVFLGNVSDPRSSATAQLIDERLYMQAGSELNISPTAVEIEEAMDEFANRGGLTRIQLLDAFASRGISEQSYRDFIRAGLIWRIVVQARFANQTELSEFEIQNALRSINNGSEREFRFSEIILPYDAFGAENANKLALKLSNTLKTENDFAAAARQYSKWPSAEFGGQVDWVAGDNLSPAILAQFLVMKSNQITGPIPLPNSQVGLYFLQDVRNSKTKQTIAPERIDYAILTLPDTVGDERTRDATARVIRSEIDNCLDLREQAAPYGDSSYAAYDSSAQKIAVPIRAALSTLDSKESTTLKTGEKTRIIMVCNRTPALDETQRSDLVLQLLNRKLATLGNGYLQELRAQAHITKE